MLNLSDKDLDRFSKEAAEEYEPGEVLGPRSWDRLEVRINQEFGHTGWSPIRHIRRFPYYYAPALVVLLGVTYYLMRGGVSSGSSPGATAKAPSEKISIPPQNTVSHKTTSTPASSSDPSVVPATPAGDGGVVPSAAKDGGAAPRGAGDGRVVTGGAGGVAPGGAGQAKGANDGSGATVEKANAGRPDADGRIAGKGNTQADGSEAEGDKTENNRNDANSKPFVTSPLAGNGKTGAGAGSLAGAIHEGRSAPAHQQAGRNINRGRTTSGGRERRGNTGYANTKQDGSAGSINDGGTGRTAAPAARGSSAALGQAEEEELHLSIVQGPHSLGRRGVVSDSALRAFTLRSTAPTLIRNKGIYRIDRNWQFGFLVAPDFTSVNSLAGDKAGSSIGLTVDYQFAPHWYISSGILATRKNYAARNTDYHAPRDFYQNNGIFGYVSFVKGSFYMMEIPLNLRYDVLVSGNTLIFLSAGASSYLMTAENANLYWKGPNSPLEHCQPTDHLDINHTNLFSAVNLSAGVETGLSNSLSLLIAPYVKIPSRSLGIGQVQMNSVGINFALKFSPITSRKRR
jgi:hypothetical protein